jgi:hypothetical protein
VAFATEADATVLEVLLEDPRGTARADGLTATDPVTLEGRNFRRFLAQDVHEGTTITVEMPPPPMGGVNVFIAGLLALLGTAMVVVLFRTMTRTGRRSPTEVVVFTPDPVPSPERLAAEIAALDAAFERQHEPSAEVRQAYEKRRAELREALAEVLAAAGGPK